MDSEFPRFRGRIIIKENMTNGSAEEADVVEIPREKLLHDEKLKIQKRLDTINVLPGEREKLRERLADINSILGESEKPKRKGIVSID